MPNKLIETQLTFEMLICGCIQNASTLYAFHYLSLLHKLKKHMDTTDFLALSDHEFEL